MDDKSLLSIIYHNVFDYPLTARELIKWETGSKFPVSPTSPSPHSRMFQLRGASKNGFYFLEGKEKLVKIRQAREKIAKRKIIIAGKSARIIGLIPTVRFVGVTGALAMGNTSEDSDIDLLLITSVSTLWLTRLFVYLLLGLYGFKIRHFGEPNEKDKLCLNMWLDESSLIWPTKERSIYSAHELGQLLPLVNKYNIYERLMGKNKWVKEFWPNAMVVHRTYNLPAGRHGIGLRFLNKVAYWIQKQYMRGKITREIVTESKAIFHPVDWSSKVDEIITVALQ